MEAKLDSTLHKDIEMRCFSQHLTTKFSDLFVPNFKLGIVTIYWLLLTNNLSYCERCAATNLQFKGDRLISRNRRFNNREKQAGASADTCLCDVTLEVCFLSLELERCLYGIERLFFNKP